MKLLVRSIFVLWSSLLQLILGTPGSNPALQLNFECLNDKSQSVSEQKVDYKLFFLFLKRFNDFVCCDRFIR